MKAQIQIICAALIAALVFAGCESNQVEDTADTTPPVSPTEINDFVNTLPDWEVPSDVEEPPLPMEDEESLEDSQYYRCEVIEYDLKKNFSSILAVGANATALKPGMLVQGRGVRDGSLSTIGLRRSPLEISINLALDDPSRRVEAPNSASIQDAIAALQRAADTRLGNLDVVPANMTFVNEIAHSFEQSMMNAGFSLSYSAVFASGSVSGAFSQTSSVRSHSVMVRLMQPMYTISFADDAIAEPSMFFANDVTEAEFDRQRELGTMGAGNQPCYVQSVTYGRMVVYTMTSTEVQSASELQAALDASYGFWSGSGSISDQQQSIVSNSIVRVQVFGGTQLQAADAIAAAIKNGDYGAFLQPAPATTAVPLSYRINDLKNRTAAVIGDATKFRIRTCEPVNNLRFTVEVDGIDIITGCENEDRFDVETFVSVYQGTQYVDSYTLLHIPNSTPWTKDELADIYRQIIFTVDADENTRLRFDTNCYGNSTTGLSGWSKTTWLDFPFDFEDNPHAFAHLDTQTNNVYEPCGLQVNYRIKREIEP